MFNIEHMLNTLKSPNYKDKEIVGIPEGFYKHYYDEVVLFYNEEKSLYICRLISYSKKTYRIDAFDMPYDDYLRILEIQRQYIL